ncbi:Ankyrin repeat domain-containing protein 7 [Frankliniella fusca]|uniref:Ankyrin repeat domain-containing protein 7 n=1 Tax=Frankliniella fusca TaxID=407009 RepID=A0AAE1LC24_9NEOP|nr:Ankyrin repeat domain-containing protein 7 [Frankliniella fusca]
MRKVLNFVKGKREDKKEASLSLNVTNISVEITDPAGVTTPSDDYDFVGTTQQCTDYEVDLSGKDKSISKLHKAAWVGNLEKVKSHLKKIDVNVVDASNRTPLHLAAAQGHTNIVWILLSSKAATNIVDVGGKTAFLKAVEGGYKEIVSNMLEKGTEINLKDADGNTALHIATKLGYYDIATVLLKNGANFESANKKGEYALHIATTAEHMDLVELLLRYGAAVNVTDIDARTPLMLAARCGNAPLVELFLEYGAKRDMTDNSSFTAQDYAINKGYSDLAALLVTASIERIDEEEEEEEEEEEGEEEQEVEKMDDTETDTSHHGKDKQRSVSSGSLVPVNGSNVDVSDVPAEDGDSWQDSDLSESHKEIKISQSKLKKFLLPTSDDEQGDERNMSPLKGGKNVHDSPNSCVIPPPLQPPRSWDLIQAGMIDDNTVSEVKRCSLTALGTLRSRRESFNDSIKSDVESPLSLKEGIDLKELEKGDVISKTNLNSKLAETSAVKRDKSDLSAVESDWDSSEESLPLDKTAAGTDKAEKAMISPKVIQQISVDVHQEPTDDDDLPEPPSPSQLVVPEESGLLQVTNISAPGSGAVSPEPVSEKRARMLLMQNQQSVELTLTDDRTEDKSEHSQDSPSALPKDGEGDSHGQQESPSNKGTLGRDGTMLGYDEMWESNASFAPSSPTSLEPPPPPPPNLSLPRIDEKVETSEGEQSPSSQIIIDLNVPKITEVSNIDILTSPIGKSVFSIPPPVPLAVVGKSEEVEDLTKKSQDTKLLSTKRHVRNKSIFQMPSAADPVQPIPKLHLPSTQAIHDQIINRQLECYDIAIRDLSASTPSKQDPSRIDNMHPITIQALKSDEVVGTDSFVDRGHKIMPDLLAGSKVAALASAFGGSSASSQLTNQTTDSKVSSDDIKDDDEEIKDEEVAVYNDADSAFNQASVGKPLRKKRKSLLAMQKLEPTTSQGSQGSQGSQSNDKADKYNSSSESEEEPAYWGSAGINKVFRQSTVIKRDSGILGAEQGNILSPGSLSIDDIQHTSTSGSSNEDVTAEVEDALSSKNIKGSSGLEKNSKLSSVDSDVESGASQTEGTPTHSYLKSHEVLLKHHLQVVTEERGRLAETTVELGEKTERLMYELADAREAARARDEVISMLQIQLQRLEESHVKGLEEVQTHRFHLDSRDQELRHLEEVCRKAQEEALHLKEIIRLKDKEISHLTLMRASRDEEAHRQSMARDKEKDMTINELRIHLKYVEQERDRLKETLVTMEHQQASLQARTEALVEENNRATSQVSSDLRIAQEETNKWRSLYESCLLKLEAMDSTQVKVLLDAKNSEGEAAQTYRNEILSAVERLEKEKEGDRLIWQAKIKEEVASAVNLLKSEYEKVEEALRKHNATLESMVERLKIDLDIAIKRQESLENQLRSSQSELQLNKRVATELSELQLENSKMKNQALTDQNKIETLMSELKIKDQTLADLNKTIQIVRQEKKALSSLLSDITERQKEDIETVRIPQEVENSFQQERDELIKELTDLKLKLQKRDSSPSSANFCNASAMTDQVRWNQTGLMGVVQKQKEEIEALKSECVKLRSLNKSPSLSPINLPPEIKPRPGKPSPKSVKSTGYNIAQELQAQAEKCLKHQQMIAGLKSELQLLRGGSPDYQVKLQKQVSDLQQKIKDEMNLRASLEMQMNRMKYEVQEKCQVEKELEKLKGRLEREFVSRSEMDHLNRRKADESSELSAKLAQVNKLLLQQVHDKNSGHEKENIDAKIHKEYEETRQYLVSELAKVQASLQAKENEERELKLKCEKLSRECDKKNEHRRKMLIEKSYNLGQQFMKEKNMCYNDQKTSLTNPGSAVLNTQPSEEVPPQFDNQYSHLLRREVKKSAEKYKTSDRIPDISAGPKSEEKLMYLEKKYCLP